MRTCFLIFILSVVITSCSTTNKKNDTADKIAVSILPEKYFVDKISGNTLESMVMIPSSASPATYEPMPSQIKDLQDVGLYFKIGHTGFEKSWMDKFESMNPEMKIIDISEGVKLISGEACHEDEDNTHSHDHDAHEHDGIDPHIWMSPHNCKIMSRNIYSALVEHHPERRQEFEGNYNKLIDEINTINNRIDSVLKPYSKRFFLIFHPALTYYARDYQLVQTPIEIHGKEPSLKYMSEIMKFIEDRGINDIFIQQQFDRKNASILIKESGGKLIEIDPLDYEWDKQILHITDKMKEVLESQNAR